MLKPYPLLILAASSLLGCPGIFDDSERAYTCNGIEYNPPHQICENGVLKTKCEDKQYDPSSAYCTGGVVKNKETFDDDRDGR